jgi:hypothetical protein
MVVAKQRQMRLRLTGMSSRQFAPVASALKGARVYTRQTTGGSYRPPSSQLQVDPQVGFNIQREYRRNQTEPTGPRIRRSYGAMRKEVNQQYGYMTRPESEGGLGIQHVVTPHDPYKTPQEMAHDVGKNRRIQTFSSASTGGHAYFTDEENDRFRAVHDFFGHAAAGRGFSRHGEEAAWQSHQQMFSPAAREAMTSETRGQNSYLNYSPKGGFPEQGPGSNLVGMSRLSQSPKASAALKRKSEPGGEPGGEQLRLFR